MVFRSHCWIPVNSHRGVHRTNRAIELRQNLSHVRLSVGLRVTIRFLPWLLPLTSGQSPGVSVHALPCLHVCCCSIPECNAPEVNRVSKKKKTKKTNKKNVKSENNQRKNLPLYTWYYQKTDLSSMEEKHVSAVRMMFRCVRRQMSRENGCWAHVRENTGITRRRKQSLWAIFHSDCAFWH